MDMEERNEKIEYLRSQLNTDALYEQLAEECCELAQAALKYLRATGNGNPTPVTQRKAFINILEEATDVYLCMIINDICPDANHLDEKLDRWYHRIMNRDEFNIFKKCLEDERG